MADWFVDQSIIAGNGTDPASAFASITSVAFASGDRVWVRKNHFEDITNSLFLGQNTPSASGFSRWHYVIGWPDPDAPFYNERPARGVTVGWDADVASSTAQNTFGFNYPTFINSNGSSNAGMLLGYQTTIANVCLANSPNTGAGAMPFNNLFGTVRDRILDNVLILANANGFSSGLGTKIWPFMGGRIIVVGSAGASPAAPLLQGNCCVRQLEVHSRGGITGGLLASTGSKNIGTLINWSTSVSYLIDGTIGLLENDTQNLAPCYIGRITGVRPYSGFNALGNQITPALRIDDYYGEGPILRGNDGTPNMRVASSGEALHNALPVVAYTVGSRTGNVNFAYWDARWRNPSMRKYFTVVSGTPFAVYVPIYVDSLAVYSPACGQMRGYFQAQGSNPSTAIRSTVAPGSYTNWTGSFISGGSAWLWVSTFTPKESGTFAFDVHFANYFQTASGNGITGYTLFGEPYAV